MEFWVKITLHTKMSPRWIIRVKDEDLLIWTSGKVFGSIIRSTSILKLLSATTLSILYDDCFIIIIVDKAERMERIRKGREHPPRSKMVQFETGANRK